MNASSRQLFMLWILAIQAGLATAGAVERPSDKSITFWVKDAISADPRMDASGIAVEVSDGIVTLSGTVKNLATRDYAVLEAKKLQGVLGVINKLTVMPSYRPDADIARDVHRRIINSAAIESHDISATSTQGTVELTGKVSSSSEREEAGLLASEVRGVKDVQNYLSVSWNHDRPDDDIRKDVADALGRDVYLVGLPIEVSVTNGVVTLSGNVGSDYEKTRAANDVRWINNVKALDNKLHVEWWRRDGTRADALFPTDNELRHAVTEELLHDGRLTLRDLTVTATRGHVALDGFVANAYQMQIAGSDARNIVGVAWVANHLSVRPVARDDSEIRDEVTFAISTDNALWNQNVAVEVKDGVVTLSGNVGTGPDRVHATTVASRIRGVTKVVNNILVNWKQEYADAKLSENLWGRIKSNWLLAPVYEKIRLQVRRGVVTLTGTVCNWGERSEAERVALGTNGVRAVDNRIHVDGYNYPYEDWNLPDVNAASPWTARDVDPYGR